MASTPERSRLFHAIVVMGLSFTTTECGSAASSPSAASEGGAKSGVGAASEGGVGTEAGVASQAGADAGEADTDVAPALDAATLQEGSFSASAPDASADGSTLHACDGGCGAWPCYV